MKIIKGFITFEGCEGVGKSTQLKLLCEYLKRTEQDTVFTREPGGTPLAEKIRDLILHEEMTPICEAQLFSASRCEHITNLILPAINAGKLVVCDRYIDSSLAYQGYARGLGEDTVLAINDFAVQNCMPEATVFLDMNPLCSWRKQKGHIIENDRMEQESNAFHSKVYEGFLQLKAKNPRFISITPNVDKQKTSDEIVKQLRLRGIIK